MQDSAIGRRRGTIRPVLAAVTVAALIAGCGSSSGSGSGSGPARSTTSSTSSLPTPASRPLSVAPRPITSHATIRFGFTAPVSSGAHGTHEISYSLSATGPQTGGGCTSAREGSGPPVHAGRPSTIRLRPPDGGSWCPGRWSARVIELQSARCKASAPCPQYIRVVGIVAHTTYVVSAH